MSNTETHDSAESLMSPGDVIDAIRATMPGHPAVRSRFAAIEGARVTVNRAESTDGDGKAPLGGRMLTDDEMGRLAYSESQSRPAISFRNEINTLEQRLGQIDERLGLHDFDPVTGQKRYKLFGADRTSLETERASVMESLGVAHMALPLAETRESDARVTEQRQTAEDAVIAEAAQGDRRKEQMIREEVDRIHARQLAEWIVANRAPTQPR